MCRSSDPTSLEKVLSIFSKILGSQVAGGIISGYQPIHVFMLSEEFLNMDNVSIPFF